MEGFESCSYIEHGMVLDHCNRIRSCNNFNPRHGGRPIIYENYHGEKINWDDFFKRKRELRKQCREGNCPELCIDCVGLATKEWDDEDFNSLLSAINSFMADMESVEKGSSQLIERINNKISAIHELHSLKI